MAYAKHERLCTREVTVIGSACRERYLSLSDPIFLPLAEAGVRFSGIGMERMVYHVKRVNPQWHSLIYTVSGKGKFNSSELFEPLTPGSLLIAPAHVSHEYEISGENWKLVWLCFSEPNGFHFVPESPQIVSTVHSQMIHALVEELADFGSGLYHGDIKVIDSFIYLLLILIRNDMDIIRRGSDGDQMRSFEATFLEVRRNPSLEWSTDKLLETVGLAIGKDRFRQLCNQFYGTSPMRKVRQIRMQIAKELLLATDYPLRVIAPMVGYTSEFAFSSAFQDVEGISPDNFRRII